MKIAYFCDALGSGPIYRGVALFKAWLRAGQKAEDFIFIGNGRWVWLLPHLAPGAKLITEAIDSPSWDDMLRRSLAELKAIGQLPDAILCNSEYPQDTLNKYRHISAYLILRDYTDFGKWLRGLNPSQWQFVFGIEPGVAVQIGQAKSGITAVQTNPVLATWQHELAEPIAARARLLELAGQEDAGKTLAIIAHNGIHGDEVKAFARYETSTDYQTLIFSQDQKAPGTTFVEPIARFLPGVDHLVGAPSYNLFWEWVLYARPEIVAGAGGGATWLSLPRRWDIQAKRLEILKDMIALEELRNGPNGADQIIQTVLGGGR